MPVRYFDETQTFTTGAFILRGDDTLIITSRAQMLGNFGSRYTMITAISSQSGTDPAGNPIISVAKVQNDGYINVDGDGVNLLGGSELVNTGKLQSFGNRQAFTVLSDADKTASNPRGNSIVNDGLISTQTTVDSSSAIAGTAALVLVNHGTIAAFGRGSAISSYGATSITNSGDIIGYTGLGNNNDVIINSGRFVGGIGMRGGDNLLINHGTVTDNVSGFDGVDIIKNYGYTGSLFLAGGDDIVENHGLISGPVFLENGNDVLDNTGGTITGNIIGGLGNDTIIGGVGRDVIYGDNLSGDITGGNDTITAGYGDDLVYGGYGNDSILGNQGDDILYGNQGDDTIHGGQGDDTIYGGQGNDIVNGGLGNDILYGNLGNDRFVFSMGFGHDTIGDYSAVSGNNDVIQFQPGTFASYADVQSHMVQQGSNVVITLNDHDSVLLLNTNTAALTADHFIFG